jgi:hypothetical protein
MLWKNVFNLALESVIMSSGLVHFRKPGGQKKIYFKVYVVMSDVTGKA